MNCLEYLTSSFFEAYNCPYQWLFSNTWGFYYPFENSIHTEINCYWDNLLKIFSVKIEDYSHANLADVLSQVIAKDNCLFVKCDSYYIPWLNAYRKEHVNHYVLIKDFDTNNNEVHVIDWVPEYNGKLPFEVINSGYIEGGYHCFELDTPSFIFTEELLKTQLLSAYLKMIGNEENQSGIYGIKRFRNVVNELKESSLLYIDSWWYHLKTVIDARGGFLEFILFLQLNKELSSIVHIPPEFVLLIERTVTYWTTFRNILYRSQLVEKFNTQNMVIRLDQIIEIEQQCVFEMKNIINLMEVGKKAIE